jgi:hypothetical protein
MNSLSDLLNGTSVLTDSFPDKDSFVQHLIQHVLFFDNKIVVHQALSVLQQLENGEQAIPVRYTSNEHFYYQREVKKVTPSFKNKSEAVRSSKENPLFHKETGIRVCFDKDGNYYPKQAILQYTGHRVSWGKNSTITNYTIAHIWGKTDHPLYFGLLWNYCLIPTPYAFLTDKNDEVSKRVQDLIKAISVELNNPNTLMSGKITVDMPHKDTLTEAAKLIRENKIQFVPKK